MTRPQAVGTLLVLIGLTAGAAAQDCYDYRQTFQIAEPYPLVGNIAALASDQDRVLVARGFDLVFLDIVEPNAVATLGVHTLGEAPRLVASANNLAAVASDNTLVMVDWSDPAESQVTATTPLPPGTRSLTRQDDILLISCGENGVLVYETGADGTLSYLGNVDTPGQALAATIHAGWLVVADSSALLVVDITDPTAPVIVDTYSAYQVPVADRYVDQVQSQGGDLVVAAVRWYGGMYGGPTSGLDLMTVNPGGELALVASDFCAGGSPRYGVRGGSLHVSVDDAYKLYDLAEFPVPAVTLDTGVVGLLAAGETTVLHRTSGNEFAVYDVRYPFHVMPDPAWTGAAFHDIDGGQLEPGWVLKSKTEWSGLVFTFSAYLHDVRDPGAIVELTGLSYSGDGEDYAHAAICDSDAERVLVNFETGTGSGCRLTDLREGSEVVTWLPYTGRAIIAGDRVYQTAGGWDPLEGLACLDVSTPGVVNELGFRPGAVNGSLLSVDEAMLVIVGDGLLQIVDFTDPDLPVDRGALPGVSGSVLAHRGDRLFIANLANGITAVDISDLDAPSLVWLSPTQVGPVRALEFSGDLAAVVIDGSGGDFVRIFDLSDDLLGPMSVSPAFGTGSGATLRDVLWDGDVLYTSAMLVYDVTNPAQPVRLGEGHDARSKLYRQDEAIVTAGGVYPVQCGLTGVADDRPIPDAVAGLKLAVAPNPFNPRTTIQFVLPVAGRVRLELYDLAGRRVQTLLDEHRLAGTHAVVWDGRNGQGRDQASGLYIARLEIGARRASTKLVLVR